MTRLFRSAMVIARRDYVATVWSKTFLIFLLAPVLPLLLAGLMSVFSGGGNKDRHRANDGIALMTDARTATALTGARKRLAERLGPVIPPLTPTHVPAYGQPRLSGTLDEPRLEASRDALDDLAGPIALIVDEARLDRAVGHRPPAVRLQTISTAAPSTVPDHEDVARGGQTALFFLTILLAGMMISNMAEEKSNKVIELLAAAVPIDAIFFGKLLAILGASLTGVVAWASMGLVAALTLLSPGSIVPPAVGWPIFVLLGLVYFITVFLLWGAIYLGIGAQAGSAREAQTLSMPLTLGEAVAFLLASAQVTHPGNTIGLVAAVIPWSSPFAMIGRAATSAALWPHLLAILWQLLIILLTIRVGSALFRTNILKSGPASATSGKWRIFGRKRRD